MAKKPLSYLLCIDLESWIFSKRINAKNLSIRELRLLDDNYTQEALDNVLKLLRKHKQKITFFVVMKFEEIYPGIIEKILTDGHEVGWHTYSHELITNEEILKRELSFSEKILRKYKIKGFQAPSITFFKDGYRMLRNYGFTYSSSIYGNSSMLYNFDGVYEIPVSTTNKNYRPKAGEIIFPANMSIGNMLRFGLPYGSSFFWGILGKRYYARKFAEANKEKRICNIFIHEWQLVTPKAAEYKKDISIASSPFFHTLFLSYRINVWNMFEYLLSNFAFGRCIDYIESKTK